MSYNIIIKGKQPIEREEVSIMYVNTIDFGKVRLVNKNSVTKIDTLITEIEGSEVGQYFDIYQLADGKGSIVAVEIYDL